MAGQAGRPRTLPKTRCPNPLHKSSRVKANGVRTSKDAAGLVVRRDQQYHCTPLSDGEKKHQFSIPIQLPRAVRGWQPHPDCPKKNADGSPSHPDGQVIRFGVYGPAKRRRQRYFCSEGGVNGNGHTFTPPLPRGHVHRDDRPCPTCDLPRGVHHGETAVARRHRFTTDTVVRALESLAGGTAYGEVSLRALRTSEMLRTDGSARRKGAIRATARPEEVDRPSRRVSGTSAQRRAAWRIAANWVEAFAPVIWEPLDRDLRAKAQAERARLDALRAAGQPLDHPQVILVDEVPVLAAERGKTKRRDGGFYVLIVAEVRWGHPTETRLRLLRALPKANTAAWRLVFDELGYAPDFIVADAAPGIRAAYDAHFDPELTRFVPSLWHVKHSIRRALGVEAIKSYNADIERHLRGLDRDGDAWQSPDAMKLWWDELETLATRKGLSLAKARGQRANYEQPFVAVLPHVLANPDMPIATGGMESVLRRTVNVVLKDRSQLANIERTNNLFDLVIAKAHHAFDDHGEVNRLLRVDAELHGGWGVTLRTIDDPQPDSGSRYSSLRDPNLLASLATARGLV